MNDVIRVCFQVKHAHCAHLVRFSCFYCLFLIDCLLICVLFFFYKGKPPKKVQGDGRVPLVKSKTFGSSHELRASARQQSKDFSDQDSVLTRDASPALRSKLMTNGHLLPYMQVRPLSSPFTSRPSQLSPLVVKVLPCCSSSSFMWELIVGSKLC